MYRTIQIRPCSCDGGILVGPGFCPVRHFWPSVTRGADPGELLTRSIQNRNLNRILKASIGTPAIPEADSYTTYCFRSGAVKEMKRTGKTHARITTSAGWTGPGFRPYLELQVVDEAVTSSLFHDIERGCDSDPDSQTGVGNTRPMRKRRREIRNDTPPDGRIPIASSIDTWRLQTAVPSRKEKSPTAG